MFMRFAARLAKRLGRLNMSGSTSSVKIDFRALAENSLDLLCVVEVRKGEPHVMYLSPSSRQILGRTPEQLQRLPFSTIYPPEAMRTIAEDIERLASGLETSTVELEALHQDGSRIWLENKVRVLEKKTGGDMVVMVTMRDVTQRRTLQAQLEQLARTDGLTGIANRRSFDEAVDREWKRTMRSGRPLSLILLDVDHFKLFNDTYGHQVGDDCLRAVAQTVAQTAQRPGDFAARYGGEELAILLPLTDSEGAIALAHTVCRAVSELRIPHASSPVSGGFVTVSCGVATALARLGGSNRMPEGLLLSADAALYRAKLEGRNRVACSLLLTTRELEDAQSALAG